MRFKGGVFCQQRPLQSRRTNVITVERDVLSDARATAGTLVLNVLSPSARCVGQASENPTATAVSVGKPREKWRCPADPH